MSIILSAGLLFTNGSATQVPRLGDRADHVRFDARRLKAGTFTYRDLDGRGEVGKSEITVQEIESSGNFRFSNISTGEFSQRWEAIATSGFDPISARLSFGEGTGMLVFDLKYSSGRVTGFKLDRKGSVTGTMRPVADMVPPGIVDQRIDWAAVSASDLESGREFEFDVYDPGIGLSHVLARVGGVELTQIPAGRFDTYRVTYQIAKRTGAESYQVLVSRNAPHILVRENFPDGSVSELVAVIP